MKIRLLSVLIYLCSLSATAQNLLTNGNFENDLTGWTNLASDGGAATFSIETSNVHEGLKAMKAEITTLGTNPWSVQSIHSAWPSVTGTSYKLRFYAKALVAGTTLKALQQLTTYNAVDYPLTTDWQPYEWIFTAQEDNLEFKFHFFQLGTILIDQITIEPNIPVVVSNKDTFKITTTTRFQTMEGFGAAQAYYENWVTSHPNKEELYQLAFQDLGLDWLRIQNMYRNQAVFQPTDIAQIIQKANSYTEDSIRILLTSWSPPANLKSNNSENGGTLLKDANGDYVYGGFGKYWKDALDAYSNAGIQPDWITIQNEPDWEANYATCRFAPTETIDLAGYDKALDSVYDHIKDLPNLPLILGPEPTGIANGNFNNYTNPIKSKSYLSAYAYHLYNGGDPNSPNTYNNVLSSIGQNYADRPNIMTEYENYDAGWLKTGWLINNVLTKANASAYFYWDLIWPGKGLIGIDNPWDQSTWTNAKGYTVNPPYYAFKHFCKHIKPGYQRISGVNFNTSIISSAFIKNQSADTVVVVLINTSTTDITTFIDIPGKSINQSNMYQSAGTSFYQGIGQLSLNKKVLLPANSMTTIIMNVSDCSSSPVVNAGPDENYTCNVPSVSIVGTVSGVSTNGYWTSSGSGTFALANTVLDNAYLYSTNDVTAGSVTLTLVSTGNGICNVSDEKIISFPICTGINKAQKAEGVHVYPVPANNLVTVDLANRKDITELTVLNSIGIKVNEFKTAGNVLSIDLATLPAGLYILLFKTSEGNVFRSEFIKN